MTDDLKHDPFKLEVRHPEIEEKLTQIGRMMKESLPAGWGFAHMIFTYGEGGSFFYTSSAKREDMVKMLEEFIRKLRVN